ncbi:hypothetical protein BDP67DRAFT_375204, partial [Colletotrichum lupini]
MKLEVATLAFASLVLPATCASTPSFPKQQRLARQDNTESLPIYKNSSYCVDARVQDLIQRMTVEEKAGQLFQTQLYQGPNGTLDPGNVTARRNSTDNMIGEKFMTHFNLVGDITDAKQVAEFVNLVQQRALDTRLGIPVTLSTDPRHHFTENIGTGFQAGVFSQWPETLGLAAL